MRVFMELGRTAAFERVVAITYRNYSKAASAREGKSAAGPLPLCKSLIALCSCKSRRNLPPSAACFLPRGPSDRSQKISSLLCDGSIKAEHGTPSMVLAIEQARSSSAANERYSTALAGYTCEDIAAIERLRHNLPRGSHSAASRWQELCRNGKSNRHSRRSFCKR
jgi:hypothetical protein